MFRAVFLFALLALPAGAQQLYSDHLGQEISALQRQIDGHINRLDDRLSRVQEKNKDLVRINRDLERKIDNLETDNKVLQKQVAFFNDTLTSMENTILPKFEGAIGNLENQEERYNWGSGERSCVGGGEHQALRNMMSPDSQFTLKYLCFDGKLLHMGTEYNLPPQ